MNGQLGYKVHLFMFYKSPYVGWNDKNTLRKYVGKEWLSVERLRLDQDEHPFIQ